MRSPDVSVIIPTYNRFSMLEEALASVFAQEFDGVVETIVVDDNSQDGTSAAVSQKYPEVCLISFKENVGAYVTRNRALSEAKGKYIAFLDSDDLWEPTYLKTQIAALKGKERCFSVSGVIVWYTATNKKEIGNQKPRLNRYGSPFHHLLVGGSFICTPSSTVFPRQVFDDVGFFEETRIAGDADLYLRCLLADYYPIFTDLPVAIWRHHGDQITTTMRNEEVRLNGRLSRAGRYYPLVKERVDIVPLQQIYAEIYKLFAGKYFRENYFLDWLLLYIKSASHASWQYALVNMLRDIKTLLTSYSQNSFVSQDANNQLAGSEISKWKS